MDPDYCIDVPPDFDDSDDDAKVHPMARRLFTARSAAEVFAKAIGRQASTPCRR
jgi:hypothetical protein